MSGFEDEEEDEFQMILEGRDVEEYREHYDYTQEDQRSEHSKSAEDDLSDGDSDDRRSKSFESKKLKSSQSVNQRERTKPNTSSSAFESDLRYETDGHNSRQQNVESISDQNGTKIKPKVRRCLRPQPKLNAEKLTSNEGIAVLPQIFADFKSGGNGSELKDLNSILFRFSHWSHRLFPSLTFDDFIEKCEQLGNKRPVKTFVSKIRYDLPLNLKPNQMPTEEDQQNQEEEDFNDKDFDYIIANSLPNIPQNKPNEEIPANDSDFEDFIVENTNQESVLQSVPTNGSPLLPNLNEANDKQNDDLNEEEMTEEQILREINSEDNASVE